MASTNFPSKEERDQMIIDGLKIFCPSAAPYVKVARDDTEPVDQRLWAWQEVFNHLFNKLHATDMALQSLTPGGSEYVNDPQRCVQFVRATMNTLRELAHKRKAE